MILQSLGGGGGYYSTDYAVKPSSALRSGNTGNGGNLSVKQTGSINVDGVETHGVILQSVGGGGGIIDGVFMGSAQGNGNSGNIDFIMDVT